MKRILLASLVILIILSSCAKSSETPNEETVTGAESESTTESTETSSDTPLFPEDILSTMSLSQKVGQLFIVRNPSSSDEGTDLIKNITPSGIIFFGRDFKNSTPEKFKDLIEQYSSVSSIPLLFAVDEEGGTVCRVSIYKAFRNEKFQSPSELYREGGFEAIKNDAKEKSKFLLDLGINLNLAPVADISQNENDFIYKRSLGLGAAETSKYVSDVVAIMKESNMLSAIKHFPGYGNNEDTHTGIAYDKRSIEHLKENDLLPFSAGIKSGAPIVMISHNIVECLDMQRPASLSPASVSLLREELGFEGVIMTDDLSMNAINDFTDSGSAAVMAIEAGCDLLCCSDPETQYNAVLEAILEGRISEERLNESVLRILKMKAEYELFTK